SFCFSFQKMYAYPLFRRQSATSSRLLMAPSEEAKRLENVETGRAKPKEEVLTEASTFVSTNGGDPSDQFLFGDFQGRSMRDVYEDQSKEAQALIRYLVKADARPNTNMALFKIVRQPARPPATSSASAPPPAAIRAGVQQTTTVKAHSNSSNICASGTSMMMRSWYLLHRNVKHS
ncbi:hypothetical protein M9458_039316, partial [Cirrhinus mrigala]